MNKSFVRTKQFKTKYFLINLQNDYPYHIHFTPTVQTTNLYLSKTKFWFSPCTPVSSTNKADHHDITEILLNVALNTITLNTLNLN